MAEPSRLTIAMKLAVVLLTGGESRRMGRDKAMLPLGGRPLWKRQLTVLRELSSKEIFVSAKDAPEWLPRDVRFVCDAMPDRGPLAGIAAALEAMNGTHLLAMAIDMPAMPGSHLAELWEAAMPGCGVMPWIEDRAEPLPAIYPIEGLAVALEILAGRDYSLRAFATALLDAGLMEKHVIAPCDTNLYANCNSPEEWRMHADQYAHD